MIAVLFIIYGAIAALIFGLLLKGSYRPAFWEILLMIVYCALWIPVIIALIIWAATVPYNDD